MELAPELGEVELPVFAPLDLLSLLLVEAAVLVDPPSELLLEASEGVFAGAADFLAGDFLSQESVL